VSLTFERRRPPLMLNQGTVAAANHAKAIYREIGKDLVVDEKAEGGGTDAAFAALDTRNPVIERFGAQGYGGHTADDEYILLASIEPRMYLATRMVMDVSQDKVK